MSTDETQQTAFRLPTSLINRLDTYAARLSAVHGLPVTRADAVRLLLTRGLDEAARKQPKKGKRK